MPEAEPKAAHPPPKVLVGAWASYPWSEELFVDVRGKSRSPDGRLRQFLVAYRPPSMADAGDPSVVSLNPTARSLVDVVLKCRPIAWGNASAALYTVDGDSRAIGAFALFCLASSLFDFLIPLLRTRG